MRLLGAVTNLQLLWFGEQHRDLDGPRDHVLSGETCRQGSIRPRKKQRFNKFSHFWPKKEKGVEYRARKRKDFSDKVMVY